MPVKEKYAVGVDLGGTNIKIGIVSQKGKLIKKTSVKSFADRGPQAVIDQIKKGIYEILEKNKLNIEGIGIGSPGVVSIKKGTVENPPNFPGWNKINLGKFIESEFKKNVWIENDANAAAIGEMIFGAGKKYESFIMITLGTGVGGGVVFNKKIFRGEYGAAGEIGHMTIDYKGPQCNCGAIGCIEAFVGNNYLIRRVKEDLKGNNQTIIWQLIENDIEKLSPIIIQQAAEKEDPFAKMVIHNMGLHIGAALASVSNLLDISTFIIGGGVAGFGEPLLKSIGSSLTARVLTPLKKRVRILPAKLKNNAGIKGASALVFYKS
jgi:glucokinase